MSSSYPRPGTTEGTKRRVSGARLAGAAALVLASASIVPWLVGRFTDRSGAQALAALLALSGALYVWFRQVQLVAPRTAIGMAAIYAALVSGAIWLWIGL